MGYSSRPMRVHSSIGNNISDEGARALAESLKQNTTLTELNLIGMLELHKLLFVAARRDKAHDLCVFTLFMFSQQHRRRGSPRLSRVSEAEHDPDRAESQRYVRTA